MISGLEKKFTAKEPEREFTLIPEGEYEVIVESVEDWKPFTKKDALINKRDAEGNIIKDEKTGRPIKEKVAELTWYTAKVKLAILDGEYTGRWIYTDLSTHPDVQFIIENFLYAIEETNLSAGEIQAVAPSHVLNVKVSHREYEKKTTDKDTGLETVEKKKALQVDRYLRA